MRGIYVLLKKGKTIPLQAWSGPEVSRKLGFPDFVTTAQGGGKVVSLTHRSPLPQENTPGTHLLVAGSTPGPQWDRKEFISMKNSNDTSWDFFPSILLFNVTIMPTIHIRDTEHVTLNPSAWGHLNPSSYCNVGRLFYGVFKLWSKLQRKKWRNNF